AVEIGKVHPPGDRPMESYRYPFVVTRQCYLSYRNWMNRVVWSRQAEGRGQMTNQPKYAHLLEDGDFRRWHNGIRNKATRGNYLRMAGLFFERTDTTPVGLVKMPSKARWDLIED